ncbi:MAG: sulfatase-like hydrolase/transferase [Chloroflexota bacterium]|nr:sulfatase-like hydrolase/transferase [Chloroflexota bacterium]MDE2946870.1 sulfatase-like hydrolase/transferase [Chloroflexota bacterium]
MASRPNILFVLVDQLGARWLPTYGFTSVRAPQLNRFAGESTVFERAITTSPVCTPYRGCLLSGRYPSQTGVLRNGQSYPADHKSLADYLNEAGYETHYVGKWHLSGAPQENRWVPPEKRAGFQHFVGWESHHVDHHAGLIWRDDPDEAIEMPCHETDALTDIAMRQLAQAAADANPFFMLLSYQAPHPPCSPPRAFLQQYESRDLLAEPNIDPAAWFRHEDWKANYDLQRFRELYFGEISHLDAAFGRLLRRLDQLDLRENTLVIFTSDHGEMAGAHGLFGKGVMYEEALHVPLIARAPGQSRGRRTRQLAATIDLLPTMLDFAEGESDGMAEGMSLRSQIDGGAPKGERVAISEYQNFCATTQRWKLITRGRTLEPAALYNRVDDPCELRDRLHDPACMTPRRRLSKALKRWREHAVAPNRNESEHQWQQVKI